MVLSSSIFFIFKGDQGVRYGYGHVYRIIEIYKSLQNFKKFKFFFIINNNQKLKIFLKKKVKNVFFINTKKKLNKINSNSICIIDTFLKTETDIKNFIFKNNFSKIISFDNIEKNDHTKINPVAFLTKKLNHTNKIFQGLQYFIIKKNIKNVINKKKNKILITTGGSDKYNLSYEIAKKVYKDYKLSVLIGPGYNKKNKILKLKKIKFLKDLEDSSTLFMKNDYIITTGGFSMFEACAYNKPTFVIENYKHQKKAINYFTKKKYIYNLGTRDKFKKMSKENMLSILSNKEILKNLTKNKKIFNQKAIDNIRDIIITKVNEK